jgi:hypothetical protein
MRLAKGIDAQGAAQDANFMANGAAAVGIELKPGDMIKLLLAENKRRMAGYDARLLRPETVQRLVRLARRFLRGSRRLSAAADFRMIKLGREYALAAKAKAAGYRE